jgi:hypothetical protein
MATSKPGGYGREAYGDPFGAGGPLFVVRARALKSHVVRVVFDEEPLHMSPAGRADALNPANYQFVNLTGTLYSPSGPGTITAVGVDKTMVVGPTVAVQSGDERAFDVHVDRVLLMTMTYQVTAFNIKSKLGGGLGSPFSATFVGVGQLTKVLPPRQGAGLTDIANAIAIGGWNVDDSGDFATETDIDSLRKRIFRRLTTTRGAFAFLPTYGIGLKLKELAGVAETQALKADIQQQILREPEVKNVDVTLSLRAEGVLTVTLDISTQHGALVNLQFTRAQDGGITS